jgi:hypothetical protein
MSAAFSTIPMRSGLGSFGGRELMGGPRHRDPSGYLVRENPWLQLHGTRRVLLNVRYAPIATSSAAK